MRIVATNKAAERAAWFGAKRFVKRALSVPPLNFAMRTALRHLPITPTLARLPVSLPEVQGQVRNASYVLTRPSRCAIAKELYWARGSRVGRHDQLALELFVDLAVTADVVLDIGANTGVFALVAALGNPRAHVHAFEIVPEVFEVLFANIVRNNVADRVEAHLRGIGEEGGVVRVPPTNHLSSLPSSFASNMTVAAGASSTNVVFWSLDQFSCSFKSGASVLMKIDVEATEDAVFRGGWEAIRAFRPRIVCELLVGANGTQEIETGLRHEKYYFYKILDDGLRLEARLIPDPEFRDWLFCRESPAELRALSSVPVFS